MNEPQNLRTEAILRLMSDGAARTRAEVEAVAQISGATANRELSQLVAMRLLRATGTGRAVKYEITPRARNVFLYDLDAYLRRPPAERGLYTSLQPDFFDLVEDSLLGPTLRRFGLAQAAYTASRDAAEPALVRRELERFVIEFSWISSAIEGNTYTVVDTEVLLTEGRPAAGHSPAEATMILNHKAAFEHIWRDVHAFQTLTRDQVADIHQLLTAGLDVPTGMRMQQVGISGTTYMPPAPSQVRDYLEDILLRINRMPEPAEKALACLTLIPYLQPFADGNKRTSRLLANAVLLAHDYPPVSFFTVKEQEYRGALLLFYEQGALGNFRRLFQEQLQYSAEHYFFYRSLTDRKPPARGDDLERAV